MNLRSHIKQGIVSSPFLYYFTDLKTMAIFIVTFVLIDIDHYIHYVYKSKSISIKGMFEYHDKVWKRKENIFGLNLFHTIEVLLILFIIGYWYSELIVVASGFFSHIMIDSLYLLKHKVLFGRAFSFTEYFIRKRRYSEDMLY